MTAFMALVLTYGLGTWVPQIMRSAGYPIGPALLTAVALNAGAATGTILGGLVGDRVGLRKVLLAALSCAVLACAVLSLRPNFAVTLTAIVLAGAGSIGTALILNAFIASYYPRTTQATAIGWALGFGRIGGILGPVIGGAIAAAALPTEANFLLFGAVAVLGVVPLLLLRPAP
jgi:AAHS family benzoate transporter-like MFS transporter